jgi:outer membrane murein-binding lipoprotein Lpp
MNLSANAARLSALTKELSNRWQETRDEWLDAKSAEFDQKYMEQLISNVDTSVAVIEQLSKLVEKIRSDCE